MTSHQQKPHSGDAWLSFHIHYQSDHYDLIKDLIFPIFCDLNTKKMVTESFFIRYWEAGSHIRMRFKMEASVEPDWVKNLVLPRVGQYLRRRPSMVKIEGKFMPMSFKENFITEYGEEAWLQKYGLIGRIPYQENNTIILEPYHQELDRYGGELGMAIAQRHFTRSTEAVFLSLAETNSHDKNVRLGQAFRYFMLFCITMLEEERAQIFAEYYCKQWLKMAVSDDVQHETFLEKYFRQKESLKKVAYYCKKSISDVNNALPADASWIHALSELKKSMSDHHSLLVQSNTAPAKSIEKLLFSYIHMHNNRLGLSNLEEAYIACLVSQVLLSKM